MTRSKFPICIVAAALLSGCGGGSQPPSAQGTIPLAARDEHGKSWMLPEAKGSDLLYLTSPELVSVYRFPGGHKVGELSLSSAYLYGECTDTSGDVFVVDYDYGAYEYAHGETAVLASIYNPLTHSHSCSVDPVTGDLAITSDAYRKVLSIYKYSPKRGWSFPKTYTAETVRYAYNCAYDDRGNLYVDGTPNPNSGFALAELPRGASKLEVVQLNQVIGAPGQVQWDGKYLAVGDMSSSPTIVYRFSMSGSTGTEEGSLELTGSTHVSNFWIRDGILVGPDNHQDEAGFWPYPGGGDETRHLELPLAFGATVSLARASTR